MQQGRVTAAIHDQSGGDHVIDGIGLDVGKFDHLIDRQLGHGVAEDQEHLDRVGFAVRLTPLARPTACTMAASVTACRIISISGSL